MIARVSKRNGLNEKFDILGQEMIPRVSNRGSFDFTLPPADMVARVSKQKFYVPARNMAARVSRRDFYIPDRNMVARVSKKDFYVPDRNMVARVSKRKSPSHDNEELLEYEIFDGVPSDIQTKNLFFSLLQKRSSGIILILKGFHWYQVF